MIQILTFLLIVQWAIAAPLPAILTRYHTANPVTVVNTVTTGTTTLLLPPVEIFISNGVSYTFTHTESPAGSPTTSTVVTNEPTTTAQDPATTQEADTKAATQAVPTQTQAVPTTPETQTVPSTQATQPTQQTSQATQQTQQTQQTSQATQATQTQQTQTTQAQTQQTQTQQTTQRSQSQTQTSSGSTETSASSGSIAAPSAIVYSPYADDGSCKAPSEIQTDLNLISSKNINNIRVYGADCHTLDAVLPMASDLGIKVNQGFWISPAGVDSIDDAVDDFLAYGEKNGFGVIDFITVGNEAINEKYCTVSELTSKIALVKAKLKSAGYTGKITTSEPPVSFINNPELCTKSGIDFVGINPHSYFNTNLYASDAGDYVTSQQAATAKACGNMDVLITETGYPSKGNVNGNNVPSPENQEIAIKSIIEKTGGQVTILTTYNDFWKHPGPYGIEQYFGVITLLQ